VRYFLGRDDDGHWYLVPEVAREAFSDWVYESQPEPEGVVRIPGAPGEITFESPLWRGEVVTS
jgi:hypothetical protein